MSSTKQLFQVGQLSLYIHKHTIKQQQGKMDFPPKSCFNEESEDLYVTCCSLLMAKQAAETENCTINTMNRMIMYWASLSRSKNRHIIHSTNNTASVTKPWHWKLTLYISRIVCKADIELHALSLHDRPQCEIRCCSGSYCTCINEWEYISQTLRWREA